MLTVLRRGIDTLEVSYQGELDPELLDEISGLKALAIERDDDVTCSLSGRGFWVQPKGRRGWDFILRDGACLVSLRRNGAGPKLMVRFLAEALAARDPLALFREFDRWARGLGLVSPRVSRIDVCADFQGWVPTLEEMTRRVATNATHRPIYPNIDSWG